MKVNLLIVMLSAMLASLAFGAPSSYRVQMSGVTWASCKVFVRAALEKEFKALNIKIAPADKPRYQTVTFESEEKSITRRAVEKSMGDKSKRYIVWKVNRILKKTSNEVKELKPDYKDGTYHLLLLKLKNNTFPYTKT